MKVPADSLSRRILAALDPRAPITKLELATVLRVRHDDPDFECALVGLWPEHVQLWARDTSGDEPGPWRRPGDEGFPRDQPRQIGYTLGPTTFVCDETSERSSAYAFRCSTP